MTDELIEIIKARDRALKRATTTKNQWDVAHARQIRNLTNTLIKSARAEFIKSQLELKQKDPKGFWKIIKEVISDNKNNSTISMRDHEGKELSNDELAEHINDYFANIGNVLAQNMHGLIFNTSTPISPGYFCTLISAGDFCTLFCTLPPIELGLVFCSVCPWYKNYCQLLRMKPNSWAVKVFLTLNKDVTYQISSSISGIDIRTRSDLITPPCPAPPPLETAHQR